LLLFSEKRKEFIMLNKYLAIGYIGKDPELRYSQNGNAFASFSVAIDDPYKGNDGEWVKRTIWMRCTAFGKVAENVNNVLAKGSRVQIEGSLQLNEWTDKDGNAHKDLQLRLQSFTALDKRQQDGNGYDSQSRAPAPAAGSRPASPQAQAGRRDDFAPSFPSGDNGFDDIPF
jgi:single-strand DNA-binding protein